MYNLTLFFCVTGKQHMIYYVKDNWMKFMEDIFLDIQYQGTKLSNLYIYFLSIKSTCIFSMYNKKKYTLIKIFYFFGRG
jgi:hypothetical protein